MFKIDNKSRNRVRRRRRRRDFIYLFFVRFHYSSNESDEKCLRQLFSSDHLIFVL